MARVRRSALQTAGRADRGLERRHLDRRGKVRAAGRGLVSLRPSHFVSGQLPRTGTGGGRISEFRRRGGWFATALAPGDESRFMAQREPLLFGGERMERTRIVSDQWIGCAARN